MVQIAFSQAIMARAVHGEMFGRVMEVVGERRGDQALDHRPTTLPWS